MFGATTGALALAFCLAGSPCASADSVGVSNGSFETPAVGNGYVYNPAGGHMDD
jgi:hypothetical protein